MLFVWILEFFLPWIAGLPLWKRDKTILLLTTPIAIAVAFVFNELGFALDFWSTRPTLHPETLFGLPVNLGLYPVTACASIFALRHNFKSWIVVLGSALFLTVVEGMAVLLKYITYGHGWNIGWTFISYVLAMLIVTGYVRLVRHIIFHDD